MIDVNLYILFIFSCITLGLIPGANVALIVSNSLLRGTRYGLISTAGASAAMLPQLVITIISTAALISLMASVFSYLKWFGVAYLIYLAISNFKNDGHDATADKNGTKPYKVVFWEGFWVSITNPKTLLFLVAFLPQYTSSHEHFLLQMTILALTYWFVLLCVDSLWAIAAGKARYILNKLTNHLHKICGTLYLMAALALSLAKKPQ